LELSAGIADRQALDRYFMLAPMVWKAPEKLESLSIAS
jgi:hypothetical protein